VVAGQFPPRPSSVTPDPYPCRVVRCRTYRYRLYPTVRQTALLVRLLAHQCELYNAALEERRGAWKWERRSVSYVEQCRTLTELRVVRPEVLECGVIVCRGTLKRLDRAFASFYRRCRAGQIPGYPRFRALRRWDSVQWEDTNGWKINPECRRLKLLGIGALKVHLHRELRGIPKAITVAREGRHWWVSIRCTDVPEERLAPTGREVGLDLGVSVLVATSEGLLVRNDRFGQRAAERVVRAQRILARKQRGSGRRRMAVESVAAAHRGVRNRRNDVLHKLSRQIVNDCDLIVHEDLRIANMVRRPKPRPNKQGGYEPNGALVKAGLNRSIYDAGWGTLLSMIAYKAEEAGRTVVAVNPRDTSRRCAACGHVEAGSRRGAVFECLGCGHQAHADINAARNILRAGRAQQRLAA
jgi:putative transposase